MKAKSTFIMLLLLIVGSITMEISAQEHLKALVNKCESMKSVKMSVIRNRDSKTKKVTKVITTITIKSDPALVNEFIEAFKKDEGNSTKSIDTKENGVVTPEFYRFNNVSYSFDLRRDGGADISVIER